MTKKTARKLFDDLRSGFINQERLIKEIISTKAWEDLGYETFVDAWNVEMKGVPLATEGLRAHVVYAMFDEGLNTDEVISSLGVGSRVGPRSVEVLKRQHRNGVPAALATTRVREHDRRTPPDEPRTVHVRLTPDEYASLKALAAHQDTDPAEVVAELIREVLLAVRV